MITQEDIYFLFDELWPEMEYSAAYRDRCLYQFDQISALFQQHQGNSNQLLIKLNELPDIGLVIASGLIFAANRDTIVPFDKYTTGWSLELNIIPDNKISANNYVNYCNKIINYIRNSQHLSDTIDFVREARQQARFPIAPE